MVEGERFELSKYSNFNFVKEIFKNLIIIDNNLLNILLLPIDNFVISFLNFKSC